MLLLQVLAMCNEYDVRLSGGLYAWLLKTRLFLSNTSGSPKPGGEINDVLHSLKCLKAEGEKWALLLDAEDRIALCAVLNKHMQHALLLQTVHLWLPLKVCAHLFTSRLLPPSKITATISCLCIAKFEACCLRQPGSFPACSVCCLLLADYILYVCCAPACWKQGHFQEVLVTKVGMHSTAL